MYRLTLGSPCFEPSFCFVPCFLISTVLFFPAARTMAATQLRVVDAASIAVGQKLKGLPGRWQQAKMGMFIVRIFSQKSRFFGEQMLWSWL
jgi:hypothetical protein